MKNRIAGILILGITGLIGFIIFSFNSAMAEIVRTSCSHGVSCPMWGTIKFQTTVSIAIMAFVALIALYLIFFGKEERIVTKVKTVSAPLTPKEIRKEDYAAVLGTLQDDEKAVLEAIIEAKGTIFQSDLVEKTGHSKVKVTRILDKLEGRGIIERKRRGMTNVVILSHK